MKVERERQPDMNSILSLSPQQLLSFPLFLSDSLFPPIPPSIHLIHNLALCPVPSWTEHEEEEEEEAAIF